MFLGANNRVPGLEQQMLLGHGVIMHRVRTTEHGVRMKYYQRYKYPRV